jgi:hypothetical protein
MINENGMKILNFFHFYYYVQKFLAYNFLVTFLQFFNGFKISVKCGVFRHSNGISAKKCGANVSKF